MLESGSLYVFNQGEVHVNVISDEIYNEFDVTKKKERDGLRYKGRRNGELSYSPSFSHKLIMH